MATVTRCIKRNQPTVIEFEKPTTEYEGSGENFPMTFEAADDRCYIVVKNEGSKNIYCGFYNPETFQIDGKQLVEGKTTVVIPIESGRLIKYNSNIIFNITPASSTDALRDLNIGVAAFQSGIIAH